MGHSLFNIHLFRLSIHQIEANITDTKKKKTGKIQDTIMKPETTGINIHDGFAFILDDAQIRQRSDNLRRKRARFCSPVSYRSYNIQLPKQSVRLEWLHRGVRLIATHKHTNFQQSPPDNTVEQQLIVHDWLRQALRKNGSKYVDNTLCNISPLPFRPAAYKHAAV